MCIAGYCVSLLCFSKISTRQPFVAGAAAAAVIVDIYIALTSTVHMDVVQCKFKCIAQRVLRTACWPTVLRRSFFGARVECTKSFYGDTQTGREREHKRSRGRRESRHRREYRTCLYRKIQHSPTPLGIVFWFIFCVTFGLVAACSSSLCRMLYVEFKYEHFM